jgi:hypothetical protein
MYRTVPLIVLLILAGIVACTANLPHASATVGAATPLSAPPGLPRYDANAIYTDLAGTDGQELDKRWQTPFIVTGWLQKIHAIGTTEIQVDLKTAGEQPVRVHLKSHDDCSGPACTRPGALDALPRGLHLTLQCDRASVADGVPTVSGCVLTPPEAG